MYMIFFLLSSGIFAFGKAEEIKTVQNQQSFNEEILETDNPPPVGADTTVAIRGKVVIYGSEPHTFAGIVSEDGTEYAVYSPANETELRRLQGHNIEFTVVFLDEPKAYGGLFLKGGTVSPLSWKILE